MSDWIVHIAFALIIAVIFKIKNWKLIITGAVLPDLSRILLIVLNFLGFNEIKSFLILEPMHTPFINLLMVVSIAFLFNGFFRNLLIIYLGVITHYILDIFQFAGAYGYMLFYPVSFEEFSVNLYYGGKIIFPIIGIIILIISLYYLKEKSNLTLNKKYFLSIIPLLLAVAIILSTQDNLLNENIHGVNFVSFPENYENQEVYLYNSKIVSENPLQLNELGKTFTLETKENLELNSIVSVHGIYKNNKIIVDDIFFHNLNKHIFSLIGLLIFIYLIIKKE
jgi:hypothetical protein